MDDTCVRCGGLLREGRCAPCVLASGYDRTAPDASLIEAHFPQFEVLSPLGRGGMGIVYLARQVGLDRTVALKVLAPDVADEPGFADRFDREAQALGRLDHPNIVGVYEYGEQEGLYYLAMEYVEGETVRELIDRGPVEPAVALRLIPQLCDALQYAHDMGVVHRDLKPSNLLIDETGCVKLVDFGLARLESGGQRKDLTLSTHRLGTPLYMAPEQLASAQLVDHRADIYSLGVLLYEMLVGMPPVGRFQPPSRQASVNRRVDSVVLKALETRPDDRYDSASAMASAIDATRRAQVPRAAILAMMVMAMMVMGVAGTSIVALAAGASSVLLLADQSEWSDPDALNAEAWALVTGEEHDPAWALQLSDRSLEIVDPDDGRRIARFLDTRAEALRQLGRLDEARQAQQRAVDLAREHDLGIRVELERRLAALDGRTHEDPADLNREAWDLVTSDDLSRRDPERAVALSLRSIELLDFSGESGRRAAAAYLDTLATGLDQLGHTDEAIEVQREAIQLAIQVRPDLVERLTERMALLDPSSADLSPDALNTLAWDLVTEPPLNPGRALALSVRSLEGVPPHSREAAMYLDTQAEALRQLDRRTEAVELQARAVRIAEDLELSVLGQLQERYEALTTDEG